MDNGYAYPYLHTHYRMAGAVQATILTHVKEAMAEEAPVDAVFKMNGGGWVTLAKTNQHYRERIVANAKDWGYVS